MQKRIRVKLYLGICLTIMMGSLFMGMLVSPARAIDTGDLLKVGGVLLATSQFGPSIDHFINNLLKEKNNEAAGMTKVVPIVSVGQGAYIGTAQVVGYSRDVQRVQAVASLEGVMGRLQGTLLVPISTKVPGKSLAKVNGVGVSAIIDLKL